VEKSARKRQLHHEVDASGGNWGSASEMCVHPTSKIGNTPAYLQTPLGQAKFSLPVKQERKEMIT
jgi:hypothetical protein